MSSGGVDGGVITQWRVTTPFFDVVSGITLAAHRILEISETSFGDLSRNGVSWRSRRTLKIPEPRAKE